MFEEKLKSCLTVLSSVFMIYCYAIIMFVSISTELPDPYIMFYKNHKTKIIKK